MFITRRIIVENNTHQTINHLNEWLKDNNYKSEVRLLNNFRILIDHEEIIELFKENFNEDGFDDIIVSYKEGTMKIVNDSGFIKIVVSK